MKKTTKTDMTYSDKIIYFSIKCFEKTGKILKTDGVHKHVLDNKFDNFFGPKPSFKFHRWAGSLKSSQAFAYNIFSGNDNTKFEYDLWALDNDPLHKACIDVAIEYSTDLVSLFEVKMFEFADSKGTNKIFHTAEQQKYFGIENYRWNKQIAKPFISFIQDVKSNFNNQHIYGEGIKQLCCHLLGIINEMTIINGKLVDKNVELYSLCFDNPFIPKFEEDIHNYKETLTKFKIIVDNFLTTIHFDTKVKYLGFTSASDYIKESEKILGIKNYEYVMNRYFNNRFNVE